MFNSDIIFVIKQDPNAMNVACVTIILRAWTKRLMLNHPIEALLKMIKIRI